MSPYISRGVISTRQVYRYVKALGLEWYQIEKLVQELAWRDYWQQVWIAKKDEIKTDLKHKQNPINNHEIPAAIVNAETGIEAIDKALETFYSTGYMHNHMRMYIASICCNIAQSHWLVPAKWMYSHLLDGDLASNFLSWQWVAGANSNKKYVANQKNINLFFKSDQKNTFLDIEYDAFETLEIPTVLKETVGFNLKTQLPSNSNPSLNNKQTTLIYNYYNLDPNWHKEEEVQRVFLLEPSFFEENPVSQKCLDFAIDLSKNIKDIKIYVGEFEALATEVAIDKIRFKEHPTNTHYKGIEEARDWMTSISGYFPSFFSFWKKCKKEL